MTTKLLRRKNRDKVTEPTVAIMVLVVMLIDISFVLVVELSISPTASYKYSIHISDKACDACSAQVPFKSSG